MDAIIRVQFARSQPRGVCHRLYRMRSLKLVYLSSLFWSVLAANPEQSPSAEITVYQNVTTIDTIHGLQRAMTVVVEGNRIAEVGKSVDVKPPGNGVTVDCTGKFVIPGLWDAHVHLSFERDVTPSMFRLFLVNGVTSVRDTGGQLDLVLPLRRAAREDPKNTPRVMVAGPLLDGIPVVYDGSSSMRPRLGVGAAGVADAESLVDQMAAAKVDLLKAYEMLSPDAFRAILRKGREYGLPVTGHMPLSMDVISASNAGLRSMEHMRNLEMSCSRHSQQMLAERRLLLDQGQGDLGGILRSRIHRAQRSRAIATQDPATRDKVLKALAANNTWQIPTMTIVVNHRLHAKPQWRDSFKYLPDSANRRWSSNAIKRAATPIDPARSAFSAWAFEMVKHLSEAGVGVMAGTDCPILFLTPGFSLHQELRLLVKSGLTPAEALEAATLKPAQYFGLETDLGTIAPGKLADLVLLHANPLDDISNTERIWAVIRDGKLHDRNALDQILDQLDAE